MFLYVLYLNPILILVYFNSDLTCNQSLIVIVINFKPIPSEMVGLQESKAEKKKGGSSSY